MSHCSCHKRSIWAVIGEVVIVWVLALSISYLTIRVFHPHVDEDAAVSEQP